MGRTFYSEGLQFQCQGSGKCCSSHGEYGYVYLTEKDIRRMALTLGLKKEKFLKDYCRKVEGIVALIDNSDSSCVFLSEKKCTVYEGRPTQCRTWPFWPENMKAKKWRDEIASFCPGVGKGPLRSREEIQKILDEQAECDAEIAGLL